MVDMSVGVWTLDFSHRTVMNDSREGRPVSKLARPGVTGGVMTPESSWQLMTELAFAANATTISVETLNWTNSSSACLEVMLFICEMYDSRGAECSGRARDGNAKGTSVVNDW